MEKKAFLKVTTIFAAAFLLMFSSVASASEPAISPGLFVWMTKAAKGNFKKISESTVCGTLQGSSVCIEFPEGGITRNAPFLLTIDSTTALVALDGNAKIQVLDGDRSITAFGLISSLECALGVIWSTLSFMISALLSFHIIPALQMLLNGIIGIVECLLF